MRHFFLILIGLFGAATVFGASVLSIHQGGTGVASFATTGRVVYYNGSTLATAILSPVTTPYASSTQISVSGILTLPAGATPTIATDGDCAIDTTDGQLVCDSGTRGTLVLSRGEFGVSQQYASTTQGSGTTTLYAVSPYNMTITTIRCDFTRHMGVRLGDGTNWIAHIIASSTVGTTTLSSSNVFYRGEPFRWEIGTTTADTGKEVRGGCTASYVINTE